MGHNEIWLPVNGFDGKYEVSSCGRVKSVYTITKTGKIRATGTILKPSINKRGYYILKLSGKTYKVHRLVALAFHVNPENKSQVNHKDLNQLNNNAYNLEWATAKENTNHAQANGRMPVSKPYIKKGHPEGVKKIVNIETGEVFPHAKELSIQTGMSLKKIHRILNGERYNYTPYRYLGEESVVKLKPVIKKIIPFVPYSFGVVLSKKDLKKPKDPKALWKKVLQLTLTGEFVATHESIRSAAKAVNSSDHAALRKLLNGRRGRTFKGYAWIYAEPFLNGH